MSDISEVTGISMIVNYTHTNSGGSWWLTDADWRALEAAGWAVEWERERLLGALATSANRYGLSLLDAVAEWERVTGLSPAARGCDCCGPPHCFYYEGPEGHQDYYAGEVSTP